MPRPTPPQVQLPLGTFARPHIHAVTHLTLVAGGQLLFAWGWGTVACGHLSLLVPREPARQKACGSLRTRPQSGSWDITRAGFASNLFKSCGVGTLPVLAPFQPQE